MIRGEFRLVAAVSAASESSQVSVEAEVLRHLRRVGFEGVPVAVPMPQCEGRPLPGEAGSGRALRAMARLLRRFHDAVATFPTPHGGGPRGRVPFGRVPYGLGAVTPSDVEFSGGLPRRLVSLRDLAPSPRMTDVALTLLHWAPVSDPASRPAPMRSLDAGPRLAGFCDAYGLGAQPRRVILPLIREHLAGEARMAGLSWLDAHWDELDAHLR